MGTVRDEHHLALRGFKQFGLNGALCIPMIQVQGRRNLIRKQGVKYICPGLCLMELPYLYEDVGYSTVKSGTSGEYLEFDFG